MENKFKLSDELIKELNIIETWKSNKYFNKGFLRIYNLNPLDKVRIWVDCQYNDNWNEIYPQYLDVIINNEVDRKISISDEEDYYNMNIDLYDTTLTEGFYYIETTIDELI